MTGLFSTVLNMSLIGSFTAAAVLLIRWFLKGRTPRWISYALWAVVLIRLLVPVSFSAPVSLFSLLPSHHADTVGTSRRISRLEWSMTGSEARPQSPNEAVLPDFSRITGCLPDRMAGQIRLRQKIISRWPLKRQAGRRRRRSYGFAARRR